MLLLQVRAADEPGTSPPDTFTTTKAWTLPSPAYAQMRIVPSKTDTAAEIAVHDWKGPGTPYNHFRVYFGYATGEQTDPGQFHFVEPRIGLEGWAGKSEESDDGTVRLFDDNKASSKDDIEVEMDPLPPHLKTNTEYKVATVSGKDAIVTWDIYVRFFDTKSGIH
jgi:hypothetical protein